MADRSAAAAVTGVAAVVAGIDQMTKLFVVDRFGPDSADGGLSLFGGWVKLDYTQNRGAAFGLLADSGPLVGLASVVVLFAVVVVFLRSTDTGRWQTLGFGLIVGGATGNLVDRVRLGYVVDFIAVGRWPNFNLADSAICVGVAALFWSWYRLPSRPPSPRRV